jgi:hypothetical protein
MSLRRGHLEIGVQRKYEIEDMVDQAQEKLIEDLKQILREKCGCKLV